MKLRPPPSLPPRPPKTWLAAERIDPPPQDRRLLVEYVPINSIRPNPKSPRRHTKKTIRDLAATILAVEMNVPILVDVSGMILSGHARYLACLMLGMTVIPIIRLHHLSAEQAQLFMIAENKFSDRSSFDVPALAELFRDLSVLGLDLTLEISGFETGEIDLMIQGLDFAPVEDVDAHALQSGPAVSKLGDLWILSCATSGLVHRLYVGDALQAASYAALTAGMRARAVITDPPFGGKIEDYLPGNGKIKHPEFVMGSEGRTPEELEQLLNSACALIREACAPGALVYIFMDWRGIRVLLGVGDRVFGDLKNIIAWVKTQPAMGSFYRSQHELIALFKVEGGPHKNNIQLGRFGRNRSNTWTYAGMNSFNGRHTMEGDLLALHPTGKPVDMIAEAILDCTERGDIVLDPFLGSGTTLIAAERTGRRAYAMELDSLYADVAVRRWLRLTGGTVVREADGRSFTELEVEATQ